MITVSFKYFLGTLQARPGFVEQLTNCRYDESYVLLFAKLSSSAILVVESFNPLVVSLGTNSRYAQFTLN